MNRREDQWVVVVGEIECLKWEARESRWAKCAASFWLWRCDGLWVRWVYLCSVNQTDILSVIYSYSLEVVRVHSPRRTMRTSIMDITDYFCGFLFHQPLFIIDSAPLALSPYAQSLHLRAWLQNTSISAHDTNKLRRNWPDRTCHDTRVRRIQWRPQEGHTGVLLSWDTPVSRCPCEHAFRGKQTSLALSTTGWAAMMCWVRWQTTTRSRVQT